MKGGLWRKKILIPREDKVQAGIVARMVKGQNVSELFLRLRHDKAGSTAIEYGLIAALVCIGAMVALGSFSTSFGTLLQAVVDKTEEVANDAQII